MTQKDGINAKFSDGMGIFDHRFGYPEIDYREKYNGPTDKVKDLTGTTGTCRSRFPCSQYKSNRFRY